MRNFMGAVLVLAALSVTGPAGAAEPQRSMTVVGVGHVEAVPDMAVVTLGVQDQAKTAKAATEAMSRAAGAMLDKIRSAGIADRDVQTSGLDLFPVYDRGSTPGADQVLVGFRASTSLTLRVRKLDGLGGLLDQLVSAGANTVQGISFDVSGRDALMDEARAAAVADALRKAKLYADSAGVVLGDILSIRESDSADGPRPTMRAATMAMAAVPIAAGETSVESTITVRIAIKSPD